jgi:hypothetical protein
VSDGTAAVGWCHFVGVNPRCVDRVVGEAAWQLPIVARLKTVAVLQRSPDKHVCENEVDKLTGHASRAQRFHIRMT